MYVKEVPQKGSPSKLQPAYGGPFRVTEKISDVVVKLRNIKTGTSKTLHTNRVRVIHEDNITERQNRNCRRAYPVHEDDETDQSWVTTPSVDPFPFFDDPESDHETGDTIQEQKTELVTIKEPAAQLRYNLRSRTPPQELPNVMEKPIEYGKKA